MAIAMRNGKLIYMESPNRATNISRLYGKICHATPSTVYYADDNCVYNLTDELILTADSKIVKIDSVKDKVYCITKDNKLFRQVTFGQVEGTILPGFTCKMIWEDKHLTLYNHKLSTQKIIFKNRIENTTYITKSETIYKSGDVFTGIGMQFIQMNDSIAYPLKFDAALEDHNDEQCIIRRGNKRYLMDNKICIPIASCISLYKVPELEQVSIKSARNI
jgi:hypothetical protein